MKLSQERNKPAKLDQNAILTLANLSPTELESLSTGKNELPENLIPLQRLASAVVKVRDLIPGPTELTNKDAGVRLEKAAHILDSVLGQTTKYQKTGDRVAARLRRHRNNRTR